MIFDGRSHRHLYLMTERLPVQDEQPAPIGLLYSPIGGGIWQIGADGQPQQLTTQQDAVPSPDGRNAFYSANDNLWLIDLASDTQLTSTADGECSLGG